LLLALLLATFQLKGGNVGETPAAVLARARGSSRASDAALLTTSSSSSQQEQGKEPAPAAPAPTPAPATTTAAATPKRDSQRWPRGVPRSIKAARWEAASSSAPTGGRGPGAAAAAAAAGAVPPAACTGRSPALPSVRAAFCEPLFCLRAAAASGGDDDDDDDSPVFVDLAFSAFTRLEFSSEAEADAACGLPLRGQAGPEPPPGRRMVSGTAAWWRAAGAAASPSPSPSSPPSAAADGDWIPPPPEVSFILTVHNKAHMVVETVLELFRTAREARSVEFVVVDDGSTEEMGELALVGGIIERHFRVPFRMVRNAQSVGFGEANTQAAKMARGEFLALINSDALVTRGWLAALLAAHRDGDAETADDDSSSSSSSSALSTTTSTTPARPRSKGVGMAGPLFLNSTGHVMEAGGVVWADATAANFGRRDSQPRHEHLYARRADYMSAACVLVRRDVFVEEIGGFDARYGKGYW
jgi:GT2 family glycosyltransferase